MVKVLTAATKTRTNVQVRFPWSIESPPTLVMDPSMPKQDPTSIGSSWKAALISVLSNRRGQKWGQNEEYILHFCRVSCQRQISFSCEGCSGRAWRTLWFSYLQSKTRLRARTWPMGSDLYFGGIHCVLVLLKNETWIKSCTVTDGQ